MSKTKKVLGFLTVATLAVAAIFAGGKMAAILTAAGGTGSVRETWEGIRNPRGQFPQRNRVNVLLIGIDYNRDRKGMPYSKGARSDTLVMLSLDLDERRISALSIPRDTFVEASDGQRGKINGAFARGRAPLAMQTVGDLLGVYPDYHIALKVDAVKKIVDALDGVEVVVQDRMKYDDSWGQLHVDLQPGRQVINGEQAVGFTRYRKPNPGEPPSKEDGDDRRMARQQLLLKAVAQKAKQPLMLLHAEDLINTAMGSIETDMSRLQILALATLFRDAEPEQMQTGSLIGEPFQRGDWYFRPDPDKMQAQVDWLLRGDESAANRLTVVAVKNGTEVRGAAREAADRLRDQGFDAAPAGNERHDAEIPTTKIFYGKALVAPRAQRISELLGGGQLSKLPPEQADKLGSADISVVLGRDVAPNFAQRSAHL